MEVPLKKTKRSKSLNSLSEGVDRKVRKDESGEWGTKSLVDDSGIQASDEYNNLEKKVDKLSEMCAEQTRAISELVEVVVSSRKYATLGDEQLLDVLGELLQKLIQQRDAEESTSEGGARSLLSAIEARPSLDRRISEALTELLQSEDLKQRIVASTSASIRELIQSLFSAEVSSLYVPIMERAHRQLLKHVTKLVAAAFTDLEENTACTAEALRTTSSTLQAALQQHQARLEAASAGADSLARAVAGATERVLERELQNWREEISNVLSQASECDSGRVESPSPEPAREGPEQPTDPRGTGLTAVDRMMIKAEIHKMMSEGAVNGAFARALQAMDLPLVVAACRAAPPAPALAPPVLLSLLQQLATDLLQDTPLKCTYVTMDLPLAVAACRAAPPAPALAPPVLLSLLQQLATDLLQLHYLEYALHKLDASDPVTRSHLPVVLADLQRHISSFLHKYPRHMLAHRICKIYETARSLL